MYNDQNQDSATWYSIMNGQLQVSTHFWLHEFASSDGEHVVLISMVLLEGLEKLRKTLGNELALSINSGYRSTRHNTIIGGKKNSRHLFGLAADIDMRGVHPDKVADMAEQLKFGGVGRYNTFTHVDVFGVNRRWDSRTVKPASE